MRSKVLACFKSLHRARLDVFKGDQYALAVCRSRINDEFQKNKKETDAEKIQGLLKLAKDTETLLRKTVIQAVLNDKGNYELKIREETELLDNFVPPSMRSPPTRKSRKDR
ncbi:complex III assembly factor LYRM7-like [Saccoglossus kowalevskii]|uniref:Complex III assembly factor LYRM7 n=1 Tax=Saccoglossus kowalevskii TaxID=10224 RepID=A0ABM0GTN0_SACKO|nr:PREDICTED: complex III assembly factor LYRM7-like [Saccoglossus kowalevskii]